MSAREAAPSGSVGGPAADAPLAGLGALVTGAGRGIGEAVARTLAAAGARVVASARTTAEIESVAAAIRKGGGEAWALPCDVADPTAIEALARAAAARLGAVDLLVNNAGVSGSSPVHRTPPEEWARMMAVNATAPFLLMRALLPDMLERGRGRVVTVASIAGLHGAPYIAAYAASKHAAVGLTRSAAGDVAGRGVAVCAVCPGYVDTPMTDANVARLHERTGAPAEAIRRGMLESTGQTRMLTADEVAAAVLGLCGMDVEKANGRIVVLDGGNGMAGGELEILNPEALGAPKGWSNGVLAPAGGRTLFVAGQTARDASGRVPRGDVVEQWDRALANVLTVVREAGGAPERIARMTVYVTSRAEYLAALKPLGEVWRRHMGRHYPAMALVEVSALVDEGARVEIEATAVI